MGRSALRALVNPVGVGKARGGQPGNQLVRTLGDSTPRWPRVQCQQDSNRETTGIAMGRSALRVLVGTQLQADPTGRERGPPAGMPLPIPSTVQAEVLAT